MRSGQAPKNKPTKKRKGRQRHVPQRTCVGCRTVQSKREMIRVVRTPEGAITIDPSGKQAGRGAYLCQKRECWEQALKRRSLERAFKVTLDDMARQALLAFANSSDTRDEAQAGPQDLPKE